MQKQLNVFIDGSWLYKVCAPKGSLASKTDDKLSNFNLDFTRLNQSLLNHIKNYDSECTQLGDLYLSTSVFRLPSDFNQWHKTKTGITETDIEITRKGCLARDLFTKKALASGYSTEGIFRPLIKDYMVHKLKTSKFQEKQVDTTVVALMVRSAITKPDDYHVVIAGDSDIIPAIKVAYPAYSKNVFIATSHPDELMKEHRQTTFSFKHFDFSIPPYYFQDYVDKIMGGAEIYKCSNCNIVFGMPRAIPKGSRPYCFKCSKLRT